MADSLRSYKRITAEEANQQGLVCKHKHPANWMDVITNNGYHSRLCRDCMAEHRRAWKYKLTQEEYEQLVRTQEGKCFICGLSKKLVIDHNHTTGNVRALLCNRCNLLVGFVETSFDLVSKAEKYLRQYELRKEVVNAQ